MARLVYRVMVLDWCDHSQCHYHHQRKISPSPFLHRMLSIFSHCTFGKCPCHWPLNMHQCAIYSWAQSQWQLGNRCTLRSLLCDWICLCFYYCCCCSCLIVKVFDLQLIFTYDHLSTHYIASHSMYTNKHTQNSDAIGYAPNKSSPGAKL